MNWAVRGRDVSLEHPVVMGILNVTPDSFSDGGDFLALDTAVERARQLLLEGADIIDIGGESTRPQGALAVAASEELRRVVPVIRAIADAHPHAVLSIDTVKSVVASQAIAAGVHIVNDVSAMRLDPNMRSVCAASGVGVVLMHSRGGVADMATFAHASYGEDPVHDIIAELRERVHSALAAGVSPAAIAIDPGIGFSKRNDDSLLALASLDRFAALGFPVAIGVSRKRFIGEITSVNEPKQRRAGSIGAAIAAFDRGARIFRVHDVRDTRQALDVAAAIHAARCA